MNFLDFAHSIITGEYRLRRELVAEQRKFMDATRSKRHLMVAGDAMAQRMRLYAGAEPGTARPMPNILSTPEDYKQAFQRIILIRAAREMEEDYGFFDGLLDDFETYVVGEEALFMPNTGNKEADRVIRGFLEAEFADCDTTGRHDLTKISQLLVRALERDGEAGVEPVDTGETIKLRYVSGDCIGNPMIGANVGPNNYNGIITDDTGRVVQFDLYRRVPKLNAYFFERAVDADHFWHITDPFRLQQYHGVSAFKNAITNGFDIDQILEFAKLNMKWRASQLPTVHTETGRPRGAGIGYFGFALPGGPGAPNPNGTPTSPTGVPQPMQVQVDGVTATYLKTDEAVVDYPNDFPNAQLHVSIEELRRECCKGAKIPYEFAYRSEAGGVVQRFWVDKAMHTFRKKKHLLKRLFLNKYKNRLIRKGLDTGFLDLSSFGNLSETLNVYAGAWQLGGASSVDYKNEVEADLKLIDAGLMSPQDYAAAQNQNLDEINQEKENQTIALFEAAQRISTKTGRKFEEVLPFLMKIFPNPAPVAGGNVPASSGSPDELVKVD